MKTRLILALLTAAMLSGCSLTTGGFVSKIQDADEALAERYGVPASGVKALRKIIGMPDARTQAKADQILPNGWTWAYDVLNGDGQVVDVSAYHYGDTPRLRKAGSGVSSVFSGTSGTNATATDLEGLLKFIQANPALLEKAKAP